jgi:hypothetical protein
MLKFKDFINESQWMYHGTTETLSSLKPKRDDYMIDRAVGSHFAADPDISRKFSKGLYKDSEMKQQGNLYRTRAPKRSELDVVYQKTYKHGAKQSDQDAISSHIAATVLGHPDNKEMFKSWVKNARQIDDNTAEEIHGLLSSGKAPADREKYGVAAHKGNSFRSYINNFDSNLHMQPHPKFKEEVVNKYIDMMKAKGKKGLVYHNTSPIETQNVRSRKNYIIFNPENLPLEKHE